MLLAARFFYAKEAVVLRRFYDYVVSNFTLYR